MTEKIYEILSEIRPENDFRSSKSFIEEQLLDSMDIVMLVNELEEKFAVRVDALDIVPENFGSVESICGLVEKSGGVK